MRAIVPIPEFSIPLGGEQLKELGLFCVVWSQIDTLITLLLVHFSRADMAAIEVMTGQATTAPRVNMLRKLAKRNPQSPAAVRIVALCEEMGGLLEDRNHLMHGLWAIHWADNGDTEAASDFNKRRDQPIFASRLPTLTDKAARFSSELGLCHRVLVPDPPGTAGPPRSVFFGKGDPAKKKPAKPLPILP
ncbi:MAG: hypothetical protein NTV97_13710 [Alphaproteobacteria bacterium]|nr:hypothetical protein [Alphaproteobacteria bacterium]